MGIQTSEMFADEAASYQDPAEVIKQTFHRILVPDQVTEVRILNTSRGTISGYFDDISELSTVAAHWSGRAAGVYFTLNSVNPALLARAHNRLVEYAKHTTSDTDIKQRVWLPLDFDPVRPAGISSTDAEHKAALTRALECVVWLRSLGFLALVVADSGNGAHVLIRIDLPNDPASTALVKHCIEAIALRFSDDIVAVDFTVFNAARIWKVYGTLACKGDSTPDRPHRLARLLEAGDTLTPVSRELLEKLAAMAPEEPKAEQQRYRGHGAFDLPNWLADQRLDVIGPHSWQGGYKWIFPVCPWNPDHTNRAAYIVQLPSGAIAAGCHHNGCTGKGWFDLRDTVEPGWREWWRKTRQTTRTDTREGSANPDSMDRAPCTEECTHPEPWPIMAEEAFYGLAGDIVHAIDPYTEADPVATLVNTLTAFGNCINVTAHARVQHDKHPTRLNVAQVGDTSKGRKGTGWSSPRYLFSLVDQDWTTNCIKSGLSSAEGLIYHVRDALYKKQPVKEKGRIISYQDVMIEEAVTDKRLLVLEPEFASTLTVMNRDGNNLSAVLRQAWDDGNLATLTRNAPLKASNAHISVIAHITKDELLVRLDDTSKANGFANRFLWCLVKRSKELPEGGAVPDVLLQPLADKLSKVISFSRTVSEVTRDEAAKVLWAEIYHDLSEGKPGLLGAVLSRAEAQVLRLSLIYALLDMSHVIRVEHLQAALAVWEYCERSAVLIFGERLGDPTADRILEALRNTPDGMTDNNIVEFFGRNKSAGELTRAKNLLLRLGLATYETDKNTGGRPRTVWRATS